MSLLLFFVTLVLCFFGLVVEISCQFAPDGGSRHGDEFQLTSTLTLLLSQSNSFLNRQFFSGVSSKGNNYGFTEPALWKYGASQWLWDSSSAVITNSNTNIEKAKLEMKTLFVQQQADGRVAETVEWPYESANEVSQMPVIPWALQAVYKASGDLDLLKELVPKLVNYWYWWKNTRDVDGNGLVTVIHPWESGIDASPCYDDAWHVYNISKIPDIAWLELYPLFPELQSVYKNTYNWNTTAILSRPKAEFSLLVNWFMVQDVAINSLYAAGWTVISELAALYGDSALAATCKQEGLTAEAAMISAMWNGELKRFVTHYKDRDGTDKWTDEQGVQTLFPLLLNTVTEEQITAMVADATDPTKFWSDFPFPSDSMSSPRYMQKYTANLMWRGPSWGFTNWFVLLGLQKVGRNDVVSEAVKRWLKGVQQPYSAGGGIWEMWNAETGIGYGAEGLGMSHLLIDWLYKLNYVNETNIPTPPENYADVFISDLIGNTGLLENSFYAATLWVNATGANAVIDALSIESSTVFPASEGCPAITSIDVTYGDLRVQPFQDGWAYTEHAGVKNSTKSMAAKPSKKGKGMNSLSSYVIPRGVNITSMVACSCKFLDNLAALQLTLSNGVTIVAGNPGGDVSCTKAFSQDDAMKRLIGIQGVESNSAITAIGAVAYF